MAKRKQKTEIKRIVGQIASSRTPSRSRLQGTLIEGSEVLPSEHDIDPIEHKVELDVRKWPDPVSERRSVERHDLRGVGDRVPGQPGRGRAEWHVARGVGLR